jgi:hypothetical protein
MLHLLVTTKPPTFIESLFYANIWISIEETKMETSCFKMFGVLNLCGLNMWWMNNGRCIMLGARSIPKKK